MDKSNLVLPGANGAPQQEVDAAFPLYAMIPGKVAGTATAVVQPGMTLLDYFAGQYLMTFIGDALDETRQWDPQQISRACYQMAHAMINERKRIAAEMMKGETAK